MQAALPLVLLAGFAAVLRWVFVDATGRAAAGRPVVATFAGIELATPAAWLAACLLVSVVAVPLYLVARDR